MDTACTVYQDPEYLTYSVGRNGFMNTMKPGFFRYKLVRYMSEDGLKRKFDIEAYIQRIAAFPQDQEP
jgi:hypothetical protein